MRPTDPHESIQAQRLRITLPLPHQLDILSVQQIWNLHLLHVLPPLRRDDLFELYLLLAGRSPWSPLRYLLFQLGISASEEGLLHEGVQGRQVGQARYLVGKEEEEGEDTFYAMLNGTVAFRLAGRELDVSKSYSLELVGTTRLGMRRRIFALDAFGGDLGARNQRYEESARGEQSLAGEHRAAAHLASAHA